MLELSFEGSSDCSPFVLASAGALPSMLACSTPLLASPTGRAMPVPDAGSLGAVSTSSLASEPGAGRWAPQFFKCAMTDGTNS